MNGIGEVHGDKWARRLFIVTIVTGSFLLFLTQPLVARMALPRLGGAPAVWNSAMLVFQLLLLGGYAYAHGLSRLTPRRQAGAHLGLFALAALWLPIGLIAAVPPASAPPELWTPWFLIASIGPLFFVIAAQAPLMQRWYALEGSRGEPYALYAASNLGSFAGLLSYPLLVEPLLTLEQQSRLWTGGYALLALLVLGCATTIRRQSVVAAATPATPAPGRGALVRWMVLAAVPSGLMLSTTAHLTTDIVALPLLWVLPLGLYLLSFVIAFADRRGAAGFITDVAPMILVIAGGFAFAEGGRNPYFAASLGLSLLFVVAVSLHAEMYRLRPAPDRLTDFYLAMSVGGMLGGLFCAVVAPIVFDWTYEHPLLILAAAALMPQAPLLGAMRALWAAPKRRRPIATLIFVAALLLSLVAAGLLWREQPDWAGQAALGAIALLAFLSLGHRLLLAGCLAAIMLGHGGWDALAQSVEGARTRSYFGVYTIENRPDGGTRSLVHGTTLHGLQSLRAGEETEPTSYYARTSGVGLAMTAAPAMFGDAARIGVVGLGTGTLACYARPGQGWTFFEIDPVVVGIAFDPARFSFLSRCRPDARVVLGDARLTLARQPVGRLDLLAVDAFSSDAVPMHLLTREAMVVYGRALQPGGLLLFHISNRYLDLRPVIAANARAAGWRPVIFSDDQEGGSNAYTSVWVALSRDPGTITRLQVASGPVARRWEALPEKPGFVGWTDSHASILPLVKSWTP